MLEFANSIKTTGYRKTANRDNFRLRHRGLLIITGVCFTSLLTVAFNLQHDETEVEQMIRQHGGEFVRVPQWPDVIFGVLGLLPQKMDQWISDKIITYYGNIELVYLANSSVEDSDIQKLASLKYLKSLNLSNTNVTSASMVYFPTNCGIEEFYCSNTKLDDSGMPEIAKIKSLRYLFLGGNSITDKGLKALQDLPHLESLELSGTDVTAEGIQVFQSSLPNCLIL